MFDFRRLDSYSKNMVDFHLILDLVPTLAKMQYQKQILPRGAVNLSYAQSAILIGLGLQYKKVEDLEVDLNLNSSQILPQFNKVMRKFTRVIKTVLEKDIERNLNEETQAIEKKAKSQIAVASDLKMTMEEEMKQEQDTKLVKQMKEQKTDFLKKHSAKGLSEESINQALKDRKSIPSVVSMPKR